MSNLYQRLIVGTIAGAFSLFLIWLSGIPFLSPLFALIIASFIAASAWEFLSIAQSKKTQPVIWLGVSLCFLYSLSVYLATQSSSFELAPFIFLFIALLCTFFYFLFTGSDPIVNISITLFSLLYLAIPLSTWLGIAYFFPYGSNQEGRYWLLYLIAVTKFTDMGAYFTGSLLGRHKMSPYISPGKSWEGAFGGLVFGVVVSCLFYFLSSYIPFKISFTQSLLLGLLISSMGQVGDLAESLLKRDAKVKNSSHIPGLGGILDTLDSLVFTSPIVYIFLNIRG